MLLVNAQEHAYLGVPKPHSATAAPQGAALLWTMTLHGYAVLC